MIRTALAAAATALSLFGAAEGCNAGSDATEIKTQFEIIGPENTVVEITREQNGEKVEGEPVEYVLSRSEPGAKEAKHVIDKDVLDTWKDGYRITAKVTLTNRGQDSEDALTGVGLTCRINRLDTNKKVGETSGKGSVTCSANYS